MNYSIKRLLVFLRYDYEYTFLFPFVILHELSHYAFLFLLRLETGIKLELRITPDTIGFEFNEDDINNDHVKISPLGAIFFTLASIAPLIPFVFLAYHLLDVLMWNQLIGLYCALGLRILLPSDSDWYSFRAMAKAFIA